MALWADPHSSKTETRIADREIDDDTFEGANNVGSNLPMMLLGAAFGVALLGIIIRLGYPGTVTTVADQTLDRPASSAPNSAGLPSAH